MIVEVEMRRIQKIAWIDEDRVKALLLLLVNILKRLRYIDLTTHAIAAIVTSTSHAISISSHSFVILAHKAGINWYDVIFIAFLVSGG